MVYMNDEIRVFFSNPLFLIIREFTNTFCSDFWIKKVYFVWKNDMLTSAYFVFFNEHPGLNEGSLE